MCKISTDNKADVELRTTITGHSELSLCLEIAEPLPV